MSTYRKCVQIDASALGYWINFQNPADEGERKVHTDHSALRMEDSVVGLSLDSPKPRYLKCSPLFSNCLFLTD